MNRDEMLKKSAEIRQFILDQVAQNPSGLTNAIVQKFAISRQAAARYLKQMAQDGQLTATGTTKDRAYQPGHSTSAQAQDGILTPQIILKTINDQKDFLHGHGVKKLGLFGSYARGEASADSDIDFLVELQEPSFDAYMDVKFFLEDTFQHDVDLVLENQVKPRLRENILQEVRYATGL